jgi:hypothetical protein
MAALTDSRVWIAMVVALLVGSGCLALGTWATRRVGLLGRDAPIGETIGIGLGSGLLMVAATWATIASGGRSSLAPVSVAFVGALVLTVRGSPAHALDVPAFRNTQRAPRLLAIVAAGGFVVGAGLLYGSTQAPSPRNGLQPVEFTDVGFYSELAIELNQTGLESTSFPSGFDAISGLPSQSWYHWGEIWVAAAVIRGSGLDPIVARNYVVLPLLLLAAAALTGTLVRRMAGTRSRRAFIFGALAFLFLAPVNLPSDVFFAQWAVGNAFGINLYGMATIAALLSLFVLATLGRAAWQPGGRVFAGIVVASILPFHIIVAALAFVGGAGIVALTVVRWAIQMRRPRMSRNAFWILGVASCVGLLTVAWGVLTGHGLVSTGASTLVDPYNAAWWQAILRTAGLCGAFLAIPVAWLQTRHTGSAASAALLGTMLILAFGAIAWGARIADYDMFHVYFAAIAVFATPMAAVAFWMLYERIRASGRQLASVALLAACLIQLEIGVSPVLIRLVGARPSGYEPIPVAILEKIRELPSDARLAYACETDEEFHFTSPRISSIPAHTGRRTVPMCFQEDFLSSLSGGRPYGGVQNPGFGLAPQHDLYTGVDVDPSTEQIREFLVSHQIRYVYADDRHRNVLAPDAVLIAKSGDVSLFEIK